MRRLTGSKTSVFTLVWGSLKNDKMRFEQIEILKVLTEGDGEKAYLEGLLVVISEFFRRFKFGIFLMALGFFRDSELGKEGYVEVTERGYKSD